MLNVTGEILDFKNLRSTILGHSGRIVSLQGHFITAIILQVH